MLLYLRSVMWAILCPGTVTILLPWLIRSGQYAVEPHWSWHYVAGLLLIAAGGSVLLRCIYAFARHGKGTLSPADPARRLVVSGLYRYVRNPMYVGVTTVLLGEALTAWSSALLAYAGLVFLLFNLFIRLHEEPYLRKQFGEDYKRYCNAVGRWWPGRPYG